MMDRTEARADPPLGTQSAGGDGPLRRMWVLYALAAIAFLPALRFHYVGEEAIFPLISLEMWHRGEWLRQVLFGENPQHNPLFNWIIIAGCQVTGWEHVLAVARAVTIAATVSSGLVLAWLARRLFGDRHFAALAAVAYLMLADVALYRGWLAYVDPLFGLFVFAAIACLWVACRERRLPLLALGVAALVAGFLTKALTAYVFYGAAVFVLAWDRGFRRFLLSPASLAIHAAGLAAIVVWYGLVPGGGGQGFRMFREMVDKFGPTALADYASKLATYPLQTFAKLAPAGLLAAYYLWKHRGGGNLDASPEFRTAVAIAALNYLPYWLAPQSHTRYLMPIYPFAALICARLIWIARPASVAVTTRWFWALLAVKIVLVAALFPYYQKVYRGENYRQAARDILQRSAGHPLYTTNDSASGLSVAANIATLRLPAAPLTFPPAQWASGFVMSYAPDPRIGRVVDKFRLGGNDLYLLCRGAACEAVNPGR
jgi:4-amino-4-deoxy-L-arabinose transferase-like glycosyltransferase